MIIWARQSMLFLMSRSTIEIVMGTAILGAVGVVAEAGTSVLVRRRREARALTTEGFWLALAFLLFWGVFLISAFLAASPQIWPNYAVQILGDATLDQLESSFSQQIGGRNAMIDPLMASFYIYHNTGIGLKCFAGGLLIIPGILITTFNAASLGASFGYMARPDVTQGVNFFHFVTAHGPFELTAIVLSAGAGLRLGLSWLRTDGWSRIASLRRTARQAMPIMGAAMLLFFMAALIEAFLSPSAAPYVVKATVALICSGLLMFYFVVLGYPRKEERAA